MDLPRSLAVRGTEAPSRLGRTWFPQAQDIMWPRLVLDWEASSRPIQWRIGVSVPLIIVNYSSAHTLVLARVKNLLRKTSRRCLSRPRASTLHVCNLHRRNVTRVGIDAAAASSAGGFLHPQPPCVDLGPHCLYDMPYLQNPRQAGTHRWHTTEENAVFVALDLISRACETLYSVASPKVVDL